MLFPKKIKFRKWQRGRVNPEKLASKTATRGTSVAFGSFGMKATTGARIRSNQIESVRRVLVRTIGKNGRVWIRIFPDRPWTQKAAEVGMGKGKGDPQGFEVEVLPGRILYEIEGVPADVAKRAVEKAGKKLPVKVRFVERG
ncbi:50S ribosomal protein L16 [Patescibacteria group bacterium]|jgi:large subunit ribosomal protein L16|nr:50S ribosomal protein L16 [Patescibacteria group bacterium]